MAISGMAGGANGTLNFPNYCEVKFPSRPEHIREAVEGSLCRLGGVSNQPCSGGRLGRYRNRQLGQQRPLGGELEYFFRHYWHNRQNNENLLRPGESNPVSAPLANRRYATNYIRAIHGKHEQEREELMAIYITQGRYTPDAVKGMVANPENREKAVADLMEKAGAKLLAHYLTFGEYDFLSIAEAPNEEVMASALIAGAASGGISHLRTSVAMTAKDAVKAFKSAGTLSKSFKPPGR